MTDDESSRPPRRVRRGEGEVTQWPRGLVDYVPARTAEAVPDPEEDRLRNRLLLAARLAGILERRGVNVEALRADLRSAEAARERGDRDGALAAADRLLAALDRALADADRARS